MRSDHPLITSFLLSICSKMPEALTKVFEQMTDIQITTTLC
ncbi:hypothetical protein PROVRUST_05378 [Providencia rustigianii DSM 4541]|uniref:Uncharacterized protein n=1 Tax=Providencia rustigianii DSM 4541 TaxID=500637 RepID=D1NZM4_9GAMM|nr:hypothetical protein PROVRUST_05378 [Providencia rustigianii DSM 4541]